MSMNLAFRTPEGHLIDFPFQTTTKLSYEVLSLTNDFDKLDHICNQLKLWKWTSKEIKRVRTDIIQLMNDTDLTLEII